MTNRPFKKISVRKGRFEYAFWIGMTMAKKTRPSFTERNLDDGFATVRSRIDLPKRVWYYRVYTYDKTIHHREKAKQARIERVSMKQEDDLLPWQEAYEVWCTYARML